MELQVPQPGADPDATSVAFVMQKGGVGKTTATVNTSRAASNLDKRVLVIDLDPQGNVTDALSQDDLPEGSISIADAITPGSGIAMEEVIVPSIWSGVDLAPVTSSDYLIKAERVIAAGDTGREYRLREALAPIRSRYDLILFDTPPSVGLLMVNALVAAHRALVVMEADRWSSRGLALLRKTVEDVRAYNNAGLDWLGVLINKWRGTDDEVRKLGLIAQAFPEADVWCERGQMVPLRVGIKTAINAGQGLDQNKDASLRVIADVFTFVVQRALSEGGAR